MWDGATLEDVVIRAVDPRQLIQRVADQAAALLPAADGALIALIDADMLTYVGAAGRFATFVGLRIPIAGSLSGLAIAGNQTLRTDDTTIDPRVDRQATVHMGVVSSICVPLRTRSASIGVLNVSSSRLAAFNDADVAVLDRLAEFVSVMIGEALESERVTRALLAEARDRSVAGLPSLVGDAEYKAEQFVANVISPELTTMMDARHRIEQVLALQAFTVVFQPAFDLTSGQLTAVEALARFHPTPYRPPDEWFRQAHVVGLGIELELAAIEIALTSQAGIPGGAALAVNAGPETIASPQFSRLLATVDPDRTVVELTEHVQIDDYVGLGLALMNLRDTGVRLAIDDTGAGFASLAHILKLAPDFIKLDRALTTGVDVDPVRRALAGALVTFAADTGACIIAEGIETSAELETLRRLGIGYGQGYFLGRPGPLVGIATLLPMAVATPIVHGRVSG